MHAKHEQILNFDSFIHCHGIIRLHCFFTVNTSVNAAWSSCQWKFHAKGIKLKTFPEGYVISLCGVVVRCSHVEPKVSGSSFPFPFFSCFFVLLFSINIQLNNCYLIKCNKQRKKYCFSREKIVHRILNINIYIKYNSEFLSFPTIYCGKTRVDNHL